MSALTDLFMAMANKIRSKTGTQTTYTPSEMVSDGIDDVYDAGVASATTPITPSNSSPASMTANTGYKPTANGYAIASYSHITPSNSSPVTLSTNIYQSGGSGYAIRSYSSITPSNSSPVSLDSGSIYKASASGYAIASYSSVTPSSTQTAVSSGDIVKIGGSGVIVDAMPPTPASITPSNATPAALTANTPVKPTTAGYAIESYNTKTPSNATPAYLVSGEIDKMGGTGYAIESYTTLTNMPTTVSTGDMLRANQQGKVSMLQTITPSNTNPPQIDYMGYTSPAISGYVIQSYTAVTPSSTPTSVSSGNMVQINGSGVIVDAIPTPAYLLPSNSSPAAITNGGLYQATDSGYAISSYSSKTPSDTSPASVSSGAIIKASSSGYLVKNTPVNIGAPDVISQANMSANTSRNITVTKTPRYIIFFLVRTSDTNGRNYCTCYDVGKDTYTYEYYGGDGYAKTETASGKPSLITTVSSTTVTVNNTVAATCRSHALIYY